VKGKTTLKKTAININLDNIQLFIKKPNKRGYYVLSTVYNVKKLECNKYIAAHYFYCIFFTLSFLLYFYS